MCGDHPRRAFGGLYHCAKFGRNLCSSFDNNFYARFFDFASLAWKRLFTPQNCFFWGDFDPLNEEQYEKNPPKGTSLRESASFEPSCLKIRRRV